MADRSVGPSEDPVSVRDRVTVRGDDMMTAMMLPSALPMISLYGATQRGPAGAATKGVPVAVFTLVYLALWAASGVPVYFALYPG